MIKRNRANTAPHEQLEAELAELALGALYKGGQVALLGHIASCADCAAGLPDLVAIADDLLLLGPRSTHQSGLTSAFWSKLGPARSAGSLEAEFNQDLGGPGTKRSSSRRTACSLFVVEHRHPKLALSARRS